MTMKRYFNFIFITLSFFLLTGSMLSAKEKDLSESEIRLKKITSIIQTHKNNGENLGDKAVIDNILEEISHDIILVPKEKSDDRTFNDLREEARITALKKFPDSTEQIKKKVEAEVDKKFAMAKAMDKVAIQYKQGNKIYTIEGIFYSYGGNSVRIDSQYIAIFDLLPEYRMKFDKSFNDLKRKEFINNSIRDYSLEKSKYINDLIKDLRDAQIEKNEKTGYIFAYKEWRSGKRIAELLMESMRESAAKIAAKSTSAAQPSASKEPGAAAVKPEAAAQGAPVAVDVLPTDSTSKVSSQKAIDEARKKASDRLKQISNTYAGIDADQGYKMVLWGMTKEEAELLLQEKVSPEKEGVAASSEEEFVKRVGPDSIILDYSQGPLAQVELHFMQNLLYKVTVRFRILSTSAMQKLMTMLNDRYGLNDEQRKIKEEEDKIKSVDDAEKMVEAPPENLEESKKAGNGGKTDKDKKKDKEKDKDKKKDKPATPNIPLEQKFHWSGKITNAFITIKINQERTAYTEFNLVKESKLVAEQVNTMNKQQELIKKDIQQKKELEELHKKKIDF